MKKIFLLLAILVCSVSAARALVVYGEDNSANTSAPSNGLPFDNVAGVYTYGYLMGSCVYLGNGYFITANHVPLDANSSITFDSEIYYSISSAYAPTQVGDADLKIFYIADQSLQESLTAVDVYETSFTTQVQVYVAGSGVGRSPSSSTEDNPVSWGDSQTATVRWGTNNIHSKGSNTINGYTYNYYSTQLNAVSNGTEAGLTLYDSGGAMFYKTIFGDWYLAGIATAVSTSGSSAFAETVADGGSIIGDFNYFVDLSYYADEIKDVISRPPTVPEPMCVSIISALAAVAFAFKRASRSR